MKRSKPSVLSPQLLTLLNSLDESAVAVGLEILKGLSIKEWKQYLADYQELYLLFFSENITQVQAAHLVDLNVPELDLVGDLSLQTLPSAIKRLQSLKDIRLHSNDLRELPPEFGQLTQLELLNLSDNYLVKLPLQFTQLKNLSELYLDENQFTLFPPEICSLSHLQVLDMSHNRLKTFPSEITSLSKLRKLKLNNNSIDPEIQAQIKAWLPHCQVSF